MLLMLWITDSSEKLRVPGESANVFGRTGALAGDDTRVSHRRLRLGESLKHDVVLPAVAEIILVDEAVFGAVKQIAEPCPPLADELPPKQLRTCAYDGEQE